MYKVILACKGVPPELGVAAATDTARSLLIGNGIRMCVVSGTRPGFFFTQITIGMRMPRPYSTNFQMLFPPVSQELLVTASRLCLSPIHLRPSDSRETAL